ncbi:MAG: D-alanyl-D-alanine carboxypeptidase/D-alanyl-D-alanine-endopeptidase [Ferruginibacter sp.]
MKLCLVLLGTAVATLLQAQPIKEKLSDAIRKLQADEQFKHAILSMYVVESKTGNTVFDYNAQVGMAPASCQKVITSAAAFEFLGKDYVYKTTINFNGEIKDKVLNGFLSVMASGDPSLGSWRWNQTKEDAVIAQVTTALTAKGIQKITGGLVAKTSGWDSDITPNGWIWEDIGNYYGAGAAAINWHENQYDLVLKSGNVPGDKVSIVAVKPALNGVELVNELTAGKKGSGDNAYIYLPPYSNKGFVRGSIPVGENNFNVSGSFPDPVAQFLNTITIGLKEKQIELPAFNNAAAKDVKDAGNFLCSIQSPSFESMNYWFLKKSINLYGEAFVKTIAYEKANYGSTDTGIAIIKEFWKNRGIEKSSLNIIDGSGLSPANRVTTNALVDVMQYALKQPWYPAFYEALPEMNGIKMKDGYISDVRSYTGYIASNSGTKYTFSLIVNNFDGSPSTAREKMWKLLNILK